MPTRTLLGKSLKKALAAVCAASIRLGGTSCASMLRDTSMAMTNVRKSAGKVTCALGLAKPINAQAKASQSKKGGTCRLQGLELPKAGLINDKLEKATTVFTRRRNSQT